MRIHSLVVVTLLALTSGCLSLVQPGFIDPVGASAAAVGSTTVSAAGGILADGIAISGEALGGAVRVEHQLAEATAVGGEAFGGIGRAHGPFFVPTSFWPDGFAGAGGVRAFIDQNLGEQTMVRGGISASALTSATSQEAVLGIGSIELAQDFAGKDAGFVPYGFAGVNAGAAAALGSDSIIPLAGAHVGVGARIALADGWAWHFGGAAQVRTALDSSSNILFGLAMPNALLNVGVQRTFE